MASKAKSHFSQSLAENENFSLNYKNTVILLIDLQQAFTVGSWRQWLIDTPEDGVAAINAAFERCSLLLGQIPKGQPLIFSICPFFLKSDNDFDPKISGFITENNKIFIKLGNCILDSVGFESYLDSLLSENPLLDTILIGGCTLTSCVRVSSSAVKKKYSDRLRVVVALELSGARDANYVKRCPSCFSKYMQRSIVGTLVENCPDCSKEGADRISPVDRAVKDMQEAGCIVVSTVLFN